MIMLKVTKPTLRPLSRKYIFGKIIGGGQIDPSIFLGLTEIINLNFILQNKL